MIYKFLSEKLNTKEVLSFNTCEYMCTFCTLRKLVNNSLIKIKSILICNFELFIYLLSLFYSTK